MMNGNRNLIDREMDEGCRPHLAEDVRGGEIILRTRRSRAIFIGGLVAWGFAMLLAPLLL